MRRTTRRSKTLDIEPIDNMRLRFLLALEDKSFSAQGEELIHSLEIEGELSLPDLEILSIEPRAIHQPYPQCCASLDPVRLMVGARVGAGFRARVLETMGRVRGCTHFMTLLLDLASAHTLSIFLRMRAKAPYPSKEEPQEEWVRTGFDMEPGFENACIGLRSSSPLVQAAKARQDAGKAS